MHANMSRAGRKNMIRLYMARHDIKIRGGVVSTATIAHWFGLKSSTHFKNILTEMAEDGDLVSVQFQPSYDCGYTIQGWKYACYTQQALPSHEIIINGFSMRSL